MPSPGPFKGRDAEPEATLERFKDYIKTMDMVFSLSQRINPATGTEIAWSDTQKKNMLQVEGGIEMRDLFTHVGKIVETDTYQGAVEKIIQALTKRGNRTSAVFKLFNGHKQGKMSFEAWHTQIYKAAQLIDWEGYGAEKAAVDAIIMQTSSVKLQQRAIQENPSYEELVNLGIAQEQAKKKAGDMPDQEDEKVRRIRQNKPKKDGKKRNEKKQDTQQGQRAKCDSCRWAKCKGGNTCSAKDRTCNACQQVGHYAKSKKCTATLTTAKLESASESDTDSEESVGRIMSEQVGRIQNEQEENTIFTTIRIKGLQSVHTKKIKMATDTGVRKTILNRSDWIKLQGSAKLVKTKLKFRPYGTKEKLPIKGRAKVVPKAKAGARIETWVYVNDDDKETSLLGKTDAVQLGIININPNGATKQASKANDCNDTEEERVNRVRMTRKSEIESTDEGHKVKTMDDNMKTLIAEYEDIFEGVGKYKGDPVKIQVKEGVKPIIQPARRIPLHYRQPLKDHIQELVQEGVIEGPLEEEEEGTWISNLVITDKKWEGHVTGQRTQIRANLDLRPLNQYVYQTHEQFPTPEELRHEMLGSDTFTKLDMIHSFHQFELEKGARKLFAFRTPWGLYRFKRLVMGNSPASSECHRRVRQVVAGLPGVLQIKDDILIHGQEQQHDNRLKSVLQRLREAGLTLRKEKCEIKQSQVKWFGMVFDKNGMSADPDKVAIIKNWPGPTSVKKK